MKLLVITNNPKRAGFRQRIAVHLDLLQRNGIHCDVAVFPLSSSARKQLFRRSADYDAVFLQKRRLNIFDARCLRKHAKKIIYDFDDAVMYSPKSPDRRSLSHAWPFRRTVKLADLVIAGNSYLAERALAFNTNVRVLPTGLDTKAYRLNTQMDRDNKVRLVWIGSRSTLKYLNEIKPALEEIGSRYDNVILRIICDAFFDLQKMTVEKCTWSLGGQYKDLAACDIGLAPLPDNPFTRGKCGFKILQYAAAGLPVVASPVGVNAEYVQDGVTGFLASDENTWVGRIGRLVDNCMQRKQMGDNALKYVQDFDLSVIGGQLAQIIANCNILSDLE